MNIIYFNDQIRKFKFHIKKMMKSLKFSGPAAGLT